MITDLIIGRRRRRVQHHNFKKVLIEFQARYCKYFFGCNKTGPLFTFSVRQGVVVETAEKFSSRILEGLFSTLHRK